MRPATAEGLAGLKPVSADGVVSYGTQTHPADGTAGMIVTGIAQAREVGTAGPYARILATGFATRLAGQMPKAPVPAARAALSDAELDFADIEIVKTHNPFAVNDLWFAAQTGVDARRDESVRMQPYLRSPPGPDRRPRGSSS